jgi:hypothetical protein
MFTNVRRLIMADLKGPLRTNQKWAIRDFLCLASVPGGEGIFAKYETDLWVARRGEAVPLRWTRSWWDANFWKREEGHTGS